MQVFLVTTGNHLCMAAYNRWRKVGPSCVGGERSHLGCGRTLGGPVCDCLCVVGSWVGLDPSHISALTQMWCVDGLLHSSPLRISKICVLLCAFCLVLCIFHLFSETCPEKHIFLNTSWTRSIVYAYVSKFAYFSDFGLKLVVLNTC
jgi:hypothetical protein